uniref:ShKT domain-containing protein n=1 Tax=Mesocestoides corti TaxID=53468 RepID=A0A5K3F4T5_MESCO
MSWLPRSQCWQDYVISSSCTNRILRKVSEPRTTALLCLEAKHMHKGKCNCDNYFVASSKRPHVARVNKHCLRNCTSCSHARSEINVKRAYAN